MTASAAPLSLRIENIEKRYGSLMALRRVSLQIDPGQIVALAGRNGSGKTTLLRVAAGLIRPSSGSVSFGAEAAGQKVRGRIGFVSHQTMLYDELTAEENLLLFARLHGISNVHARVADLLAEAGLRERRGSLVRTFSRGMRQRLTIARALLPQPSLLLLDEPGTGLDVLAAAWLAATLGRLREQGCTMFMSLHGLSELSTIANRAVRLEAGAIVADSQSGAPLESVLRGIEA